jgi:phospholipid/cholesterol/gamma-HCH transport system substrate-binding protein
METRANYVIVGVFTLMAMLAAFVFVYWTARYGNRSETAQVTIRIPGSAAGLGRGSAILFNGIRVGEVQNVFLDPKDPTVAIADGAIDSRTPLKASTRAALGIQGLTGQAYVEFKGGSADEPNLIGATNGPIELEADPSFLNDVVDAARTLVNRAGVVLSTFEGTLADVRQPLTNTVKNAETFSNALAARSGDIDLFLKSTGDLSKSLSSASDRLQITLGKVDAVISAVDPAKVKSTLENVDVISKRLAESSAGVEALVASAKLTSDRAAATMLKIDALVASLPPEDIKKIVTDLKGASGQVSGVMDNATKAAAEISALVTRINKETEGVGTIVKDTTEMMARLNAASVRVDGVLQKVDALLGSGEANGVVVELKATLAGYRKLADTLNARVPGIANGLERFTGNGLRDIQRAVTGAQDSIQRIERAITDLSANPQRIITGGDGEVRTFDGKKRR